MIITEELALRIQSRPVRPTPKMLTPTEEINLMTLWLEGHSPNHLAKAQGISKTRMYTIVAKWKETAAQVLAK